jgi:hypothetical protein
MKKISAIATMLVLLAACAVVMAQSRPRVTASIPFEFGVGNKVLPAGKYTIRNLSSSSPVMVISSLDNKEIVNVNTQTASSLRASSRTKLIFRRYGSQYFLAQVWFTGEHDGTDFPTSKAERRARKAPAGRHLAQTAVEPEYVTILVE